jgi:hypothetical protein
LLGDAVALGSALGLAEPILPLPLGAALTLGWVLPGA